jgi:hypothetical protein
MARNFSPIIENPVAYENAVKSYIIGNAQKTWRANNPDTCGSIESFINAGRTSGRGYTDNFIGSMAKAFDSYGKLTEKQMSAILKMIASAEERRANMVKAIEEQKARSTYLGVANERISTKVTVDKIVEVEVQKFSYYDSSTMYIYLMRDEAGNRIVYKTKSALVLTIKTDEDTCYMRVEEKDLIGIKGTIKAHVEYKGEKQTIIQRAKVTSIAVKETEGA